MVYLDPKKGANGHDYHNHHNHHQPSHLSKIVNIKALFFNKLPCHYYLSWAIITDHQDPSMTIIDYHNNHKNLFQTTNHQYQTPTIIVLHHLSLAFTWSHQPSVSITYHHRPSLSIIRLHLLSSTISVHHLPSKTFTTYI